jgi:hypothetical protein
MGTVPVAVIEKDLCSHFGGKVDVGVRYHDHGGRRRNHKGRRGRNIDANIDLHLGYCSV